MELRLASYAERLPLPALAGAVRTVWVHQTGDEPYRQRHLPTGGLELHWPIGGPPRLLGPLTGAVVETIPVRTTILGIRFWPGAPPLVSIALEELLDQDVPLTDLGLRWVDRVGEALVRAITADEAVTALQLGLVRELGPALEPDQLLAVAVRRLMPWQPVEIDALAEQVGLSASQLRRRCRQSIGVSPKTLQRTLRLQGFLALAQAGSTAAGLAQLAVDVGYADQAHLSRECLRLTGLTPSGLLGAELDRCQCGHDHVASYQPFLARRPRG